MDDCIFCKIIAGEIPSKRVYEDDELVIFQDIEPKAPVHLLCVPKEHFASLSDLDEARAALVGRILRKVGRFYKEFGLEEGYRVIINQGENGGQTVPHLHIHLLGGEPLNW
ncbi:MAG: histidine triad nucleotide-binding protein [Clostridia bacterium]|nr:histidine triad nucleotide-binding protein [Clostridia bacterium]